MSKYDDPMGGPSIINPAGGTIDTLYSNSGGGRRHHQTEADFASVAGLGNLLDLIPELNSLVTKAINQNWSTAKFQNAVEDSDWWKNHSDAARQVIIMRANDPSTFRQNLQQTAQSVEQVANQLGFDVNPAQAHAIALRSMMTGNSSNQQWITDALSNRQDYSHIKSLSGLQGGMASTAQQLQALADAYGFKGWTAAEIAARAQNVVDGSTTIDTYKLRLQNWAKSAFPALAKDIESGATVMDMASPYIQSMSQLLEINPGQLNLYTPLIRRALQGVQDPKTKDRTAVTLSDFEDQVRRDPRWQYTQNAKDTVSQAVLQVGADWGFGPEG